MSQQPVPGPSGWYPDPFRRHHLRFFDGVLWTEHVANAGIPSIDTVPVADGPRSRPPDRTAGADRPPEADGDAEAPRIVPESGPRAGLLDSLVLVVDEEGTVGHEGRDCVVRDQWGRPVGAVRVVREWLPQKVLRLITSDTHREISRIQVLDPVGAVLLSLHRPRHMLKQRVIVEDGAGAELGELVLQHQFTRTCFTLEAGGQVLGVADSEEPGARDMKVVDATGASLARVTRTWEVLSASHHPVPHSHVVQLPHTLSDPLRSLVLGALLGLEAMLAADAVPVP